MKLPSLRRKAIVSNVAPAESPVRVFVSRLFKGTKRGVTTIENIVAAKKALEHPIIFRALNKVGLTVQSVGWYVTENPDAKAADTVGTKRQREALQKVLNNPNANMSGAQLRYFAALSWACFGKMAFKVSVMSDGTVAGIFPLGIEFLRFEVDQYGQAKEFEYGSNGNKVKIPSLYSVKKNDKGQPTDSFAFLITKPSLSGALDMEKHNTPLQSIGLPKAVYDSLMMRALETADGAPNSTWLVTADRDLDAPQAEAVKEAVEDSKPGQDESGGVIFIAGSNINVQELKNDLSDIHSKVPADDMIRQMFGAFGIPLALANIGGADGGKFANNYDESRKAFFEDTIEPEYLSPIEEGFTQALCVPGYVIKFDRDNIPALRKSRAETAGLWDKIVFLDDNEKREAAGWPKRKTPKSTPTETTTDE